MKYHTPTIPVVEEGKRLMTLGLVIVILAGSMPNKSVAAELGDLPSPALLTDVVTQLEKPNLAPPTYTKVTVVRTHTYVPMTAYTSRPEETDDTPFITADGSHVRDGIVAANFLPFGTKIRIPALFGDKVFEVHDRMNKRYPYKVDVWMDDLGKARQFGVRYANIEVVKTQDVNQK